MNIPIFQKVVMIVSIIILISCLTFVGITLYRHPLKEKYPPVVGSCPDYWDDITDPSLTGDTRGVTCYNTGINPPAHLENNLGSLHCPSKGGRMQFTSERWRGKNGTCYKAEWAKQCGVTWDGITNSNMNCNKPDKDGGSGFSWFD